MAKILVSGIMNVETTVQIDAFPLAYAPIHYAFWGLKTNVSGVGMNVARALRKLGNEVVMVSMTGEDIHAQLVRAACHSLGMDTGFVMPQLKETPQSVVLYDKEGRRQIHTDLKDAPENVYPTEGFLEAAKGCEILVLCNVNFSRFFLKQAKSYGKIIATDVQAIGDVADAYHQDFLAHADILFMSHERISGSVENFVREIAARYQNRIIVVGLGKKGALLYQREEEKIQTFPAVTVRKIVNTVGAGDALFSSFIHFYAKGLPPQAALKRAMLFAAYKIGAQVSSEGLMTEAELEILLQNQFK